MHYVKICSIVKRKLLLRLKALVEKMKKATAVSSQYVCSLKDLLLLLSAFPFSQGWPQCINILHIFLSSMSVSFAPTSPISSFTTSKNLLFGLPLLLFPGNSISIIFLPTYSWSLLMTCPYHISLPSLIFIPNRSTLTVLLMFSFLILFFLVTPIANLSIFISVTSISCDCYCLKSIHHCWSYH